MFSFDSNHRGFGNGSIIDCRTLLIPWLLKAQEFRGFGDTKSCSMIPFASLMRELVSLSMEVDGPGIVLEYRGDWSPFIILSSFLGSGHGVISLDDPWIGVPLPSMLRWRDDGESGSLTCILSISLGAQNIGK
jgi:hypothetical protein